MTTKIRVRRGTLVAVFVLSAAMPAAAQTAAKGTAGKSAEKAAAARTPWGDPDLQGTWTTDSAQAIPMQRPDQFAGRAELTDEEFKHEARARHRDRSEPSERHRFVRG